MIIRRAALKAALHATAAAGERRYPSMEGLHLLPDGTVEATDGTILVRITDRSPFPDADFPQVEGAAVALGPPATGILCPADTAKKLIAAMPKKTPIPILQAVQAGVRDGHTYAMATDLQTPLVVCLDRAQEDAQFPKTDRVMITDGSRDVIRVTLSASMLDRLAAVAKEVCRSGSTQGVCLEIPTGPEHREGNALTDSIRFTIAGDDCTVEGVCMPCRL